jgi:hypothetical protein
MGGKAKAPKRVAGLNQRLELVPSICQNEALQLLYMMVLTHHHSCNWRMPGGLLRKEPLLYPELSVLISLLLHSSVITEDIAFSVEYVKQCM